MRMLLHPEYRGGPFGDPALYVWQVDENEALLVDCGDLTRFTPRQLLKTRYVLLSHCHMDHFFGFDLFLRVLVGSEKKVTIFGPPETSERVGGKLQGYTWNLVGDQSLEFIVIDLDSVHRSKTETHFHAKDRFRPSLQKRESWDPASPILDTGVYHVQTVTLDHRTPSQAYAVEEKVTVSVDSNAIQSLGLKPGAWLNALKAGFLFGAKKGAKIQVLLEDRGSREFSIRELAKQVLVPRQRHKISYVTDGAAHEENRRKLIPLVQGSDVLFSETCFLQKDVALANATQHFTARFVGEMAKEARVKKIAPIHFSKRYLECPEVVIREVEESFQGEVERLVASPSRPHL